jgi:hypothetical protein
LPLVGLVCCGRDKCNSCGGTRFYRDGQLAKLPAVEGCRRIADVTGATVALIG